MTGASRNLASSWGSHPTAGGKDAGGAMPVSPKQASRNLRTTVEVIPQTGEGMLGGNARTPNPPNGNGTLFRLPVQEYVKGEPFGLRPCR